MRRLCFNLLAGFSLLLCLASITLWIWSHFLDEEIGWSTQSHTTTGLGCYSGSIALAWITSDTVNAPGFLHHSYDAQKVPLRVPPGVSSWQWWGFMAYVVRASQRQIGILIVPAWAPTALFAALPLLWLLRFRSFRRRWRAQHNFCATCGYDLRATPDRCPECGTAVGGVKDPKKEPA